MGSSSALSFRFDLQSVRLVERETLQQHDLLALAPPTGGATYRGTESMQKKLIADLDERSLEAATAPPPPPAVAGTMAAAEAAPGRAGGGHGSTIRPRKAGPFGGGLSSLGSGVASAPMPAQNGPGADGLAPMAQSLRGSQEQIVIEGFAKDDDKDKQAASLSRANKIREELLRSGVSPNQVLAVGRGSQPGRARGRSARRSAQGEGNVARQRRGEAVAEPIGTSNFESGNTTSVARGTSAMISILKRDTEGEVVYLYDPESNRGNAKFPFKGVRLKNPSDSALETGPVTVFGDGHFIGEGMAEPTPARGTAFVPFALDRQIVVDQATGESDDISRVLTVQRGVFSTEVQHKRRTTFTLTKRQGERAVAFVRHTVPVGYKLSASPPDSGDVKLGAANLLRVVLEPHAKKSTCARPRASSKSAYS